MEEVNLRRNPAKQHATAPEETNVAALEKLATLTHEIAEHQLGATIDALKAQALRHETAIDNISQGVCFFDNKERLILCNRRYAEIYGLKPEEVSPGTTLSEIAERRFAIGTCPMTTIHI
jgi:PAS domain-containing protein